MEGLLGDVLLDEIGTNTTIECSIVHDLVDLENNTNAQLTNVVEEAPYLVFEDSTIDFHLKPDSIAVDFCIENKVSEVNYDRDYQDFGLNIPDVGNFPEQSRVYDAGADEYIDVIFKDGMEEQP